MALTAEQIERIKGVSTEDPAGLGFYRVFKAVGTHFEGPYESGEDRTHEEFTGRATENALRTLLHDAESDSAALAFDHPTAHAVAEYNVERALVSGIARLHVLAYAARSEIPETEASERIYWGDLGQPIGLAAIEQREIESPGSHSGRSHLANNIFASENSRFGVDGIVANLMGDATLATVTNVRTTIVDRSYHSARALTKATATFYSEVKL